MLLAAGILMSGQTTQQPNRNPADDDVTDFTIESAILVEDIKMTDSELSEEDFLKLV